jgi:type IV conjugative transfer system coupling protein TraD
MSDKAKQFTRGGQITFHNIRMLFQVNKIIWQIYLLSLLCLIILATYLLTPNEIFYHVWYWCLAHVNQFLEFLGIKLGYLRVSFHGKILSLSPKTYLQQAYFRRQALAIFPYLRAGASMGFIASLGVFYGLIKWLISRGKKQTDIKHVRGSKLGSIEDVIRLLKSRKQKSDITLGGLPLVLHSETQHILVHGTTGVGKTQLIYELLDQLRSRGDKVFLYDKGGVYTSTFFRPGKDRLLNPFDARCENWDLWCEARSELDFRNLAESLIPVHGEADPFWINAGRSIFGSAAFTMQNDSDRSIKKLLKLLISNLDDLHKYLSESEAAVLTSSKIEKTALSIRSTIIPYLRSLKPMIEVEERFIRQDIPKFCIRDWLCNDNDNSWLFLSSNGEQHSSLKPLLSMWFSMATIKLLSLLENRERRVWFICDELPSLHRLPQLSESLAEARKYGGCFVLGMQSFAQLEDIYGSNGARGIFDTPSTSFFFRSPSHNIAELVARSLGSQEVEDTRENYSYGANTIRDGISIGSHRIHKQLVTAAEIMNLDNLRCYARLLGNYPIVLLPIELKHRKQSTQGFIARDVRRRDNQDSAVIIKKIPLAIEEQADKNITSGAVLQGQTSPIALPIDNYSQNEFISKSTGDNLLVEFFGEAEKAINGSEK